MDLKFEAWLSEQQSREDEIGALARLPTVQEYEATVSKRRVDEHHSWVNFVVGILDRRQVPVFNDAWQEFIVAKKAANEVTD